MNFLMPTPNKTVRSERRKITATALNNVAVSFIVTGLVVPLVSVAYQLSFPRTRYWGLFAVMWLMCGLGLHLASRRMLGDIQE